MSFEAAWARANAIDGWLTKKQAESLYRAASAVHEGKWIVEIGSHHGRSTVVLDEARRPGVHLLAVDPYDDARWGGGEDSYSIFRRNCPNVELFRGTSRDAAETFDKKIGLVFLDGAHDRHSAAFDLDAWQAEVVLVHDAFSATGVTRALLRRRLLSSSYLYEGSVGSLARLRRTYPGLGQRAVSGVKLVLRLGFFFRNLLVKALMSRGRSARLLGWTEADYPY